MGLQAEEKVALISHNNRCEWNIMDHAIMQAGAIDIPIYPTMTEEDYKYILNHSESKYCFVSNEELYNKVMAVKAECPTLVDVFTFEDVKGARHWTEVAKAGSDDQQAELEARRDAVDPAQLATIIYTSGTTGLPKGVMLSHNNVASNVLIAQPRVPAVDPNMDYRVLSFLPVCHIFERMLHYLYMYMGAQIHFGESLETIKEDLNHTQPIMFTAVPRLLEKFYDGIVAKGRAAGGVKSAIFNWPLVWPSNGTPTKAVSTKSSSTSPASSSSARSRKPSASVAFKLWPRAQPPFNPASPASSTVLASRCWKATASRRPLPWSA